ncbi:HXXEE domain-containing protein [Bacillus sp. JJ1609]|uniref:HXXEE domain-containing protein n=1 Tax=Bacillus sp. JJ1609 TaxID=3122977 RepID=UPI002FFDF326
MAQQLDIQTLIWLFPIVFIFHDFEEIIMLERWVAKNSSTVSKVLPARMAERVLKQFSLTTAQMSVAVLIVFLFVSSSTFMASQYLKGGPAASIQFFTVLILVFFIHVFTHIGQSILFRSITPGVITSVLLVLPYSFVMLNTLLEREIINWDIILTCLPYVLLAIPVVVMAHSIGKRVT